MLIMGIHIPKPASGEAIPSWGYGGNRDLTKTLNYISIKVREVLSRTCSLVAFFCNMLFQLFYKHNAHFDRLDAQLEQLEKEQNGHCAEKIYISRWVMNQFSRMYYFGSAKIGIDNEAATIVCGTSSSLDGAIYAGQDIYDVHNILLIGDLRGRIGRQTDRPRV